MQQITYRYCRVDAGTWLDNEVIEGIENAKITFDKTLPTKGMMTFTTAENLGETYIRAYAILNNSHPVCIGTFLAQTQTAKHDGKDKIYQVQAYTSLLELKEKYPPIGYTISKNTNIAEMAYKLANEHCRAPVISGGKGQNASIAFIAGVEETWLDYLTELLDADNKLLLPSYTGSILIVPKRDANSMQPVHVFQDNSKSLVCAEVEEQRDLYRIPNRVLVISSNGLLAVAENDDDNNSLSINNRGRVVEMRITNPSLPDECTQDQLDDYAERELKSASLVEHRVQITHDWIPNISIEDCVRLELDRADIHARGIVESMEFSCDTKGLVKTTISFTEAMI